MIQAFRRVLVSGAAILSAGATACSDAAEPPAPVNATIGFREIRQVEDRFGLIPPGTIVDPSQVRGLVSIVFDVIENDETVSRVSVEIDDLVWECAPSGAAAPAEAGGRSSAAIRYECQVDTATTSGPKAMPPALPAPLQAAAARAAVVAPEDECEGPQLDPLYPNGLYAMMASLTTDEGQTREAADQFLTFVNSDFVVITHLDAPDNADGQGVAGPNGTPFLGGPADLDGDGTEDNTVTFAVCPASYRGTRVAELELRAFRAVDPAVSVNPDSYGRGDVDLGSGPGALHRAAVTPFLFTVQYGPNEMRVEDYPIGTSSCDPACRGHTFEIGQIIDTNGMDVTADFATLPPPEVFLDFTGPQSIDTNGDGSITPGILLDDTPIVRGTAGANSAGNPLLMGYYSGGAFSLLDVGDAGVGFAFGQTVRLDVEESGSDGMQFPDVASIGDVAEDDGLTGGIGGPPDGRGSDQGGVDAYEAEVRVLMDFLSNVTSPDAFEWTSNPSPNFGVDTGSPILGDIEPDAAITVLNPDADGDGGECADLGDCTLSFNASDPVLTTGDAGSLLNDEACGTAGGCSAITATVNAAPTGAPSTLPVFESNGVHGQQPVPAFTDELSDPDFSVSLLGSLPDGAWEVALRVPDNAYPTPNFVEHTFMFVLDDTPPAFSALDPAPDSNPGTTEPSITFAIGGTISDANIIRSSPLSVRESTDTTCGNADDVLLSVASGRIDRQSVDLANGTSSITFSESFTVSRPPAVGSRTYCFHVEAMDEAVLGDGTLQGNRSAATAQALVTWLASSPS